MHVFEFSLQFLSETFLTLRRIRRDIIKSVHRSVCKVPVILSDFSETWIFSSDFPKHTKMRFYENFSRGGRVVPCGRTGVYEEANGRCSQFC